MISLIDPVRALAAFKAIGIAVANAAAHVEFDSQERCQDQVAGAGEESG